MALRCGALRITHSVRDPSAQGQLSVIGPTLRDPGSLTCVPVALAADARRVEPDPAEAGVREHGAHAPRREAHQVARGVGPHPVATV